jgi:hypothetical protein
MATTPVLPITELDFFRAKAQLKDFLRSDPSGRFRDIDFEGANISVLLDVLAYNTYQNNFYTNMAISEMFLDTAQLENSIVSHVKELNYTPRSATSAKAIVNVTISDPTLTDATVLIPENTRFTTNQGNTRFNFFTREQYVARRTGSVYIANNVEVYEGELIEEAFIVAEQRKTIRLVNQNIDTTSIRVFENYEQPLDRIEYVYRKDIFGVGPVDPVFYLEPAFDGTYEVVFGKNRFGKEPPLNSQIRVLYRITNAAESNGSCRFTTNDIPGTTVVTAVNAAGGAAAESIEDIKFFAPKSIQVQERAVTERDYEILLKQQFNEIQDISVFGGDELDPPRFGKVAIAVNVAGGLSDIAAKKYESFLRDKTPVGIQPILLPPEYLYVDLAVDVSFSSKQTTVSTDAIERLIRESLQDYNISKLNKFGATFELSRASSIIDLLNPGIINNTLTATPYILYSPDFNQKRSPTFVFGASLESPSIFARVNKTENYNSFVRSSIFVFDGAEVIFEDNGLGSINIVNARNRDTGVVEIIKRNAGTVDYATGTVKLSDFIVESYTGNGIKIFANTEDKNVTSPKQRVLVMQDSDVSVNIREVSER